MADEIGFKMVTEPFTKMLEEKKKRMPRAAMWAVREAGRVARKTAAAKAPVLKQKGVATHRQLQRTIRTGTVEEAAQAQAAYGRAVPGLLRASIKPSKAVRHGPSEVSLKVAPRGPRVHLYAGKQEEARRYMEAGEAAAKAAMPSIAREAFEKVWKD